MSIRSNSRPTGYDLSPELQDILRRNGMQAHVIRQGDAMQLAVQGHDSPLLTYNLNAKQVQALTDWGTNYSKKHAYDTFADLVQKDFYMPRNFVYARNANGRVAMGLHGYRIGAGEYGRPMGRQPFFHRDMWGHHHGFLGWTPRHQDGFHMRRVGGALFMQGAPMVPERPDGRMKPGEMKSGAYGFYYKGQQGSSPQPQQDVLQELQSVITPIQTRPRPQEPAKPYKELITSNVYFSNDKWQEVLASHGIVVDAQAKTLTIQSSAAKQDFVYDLTDAEVKRLTSNSIKAEPIQKRLDTINSIIRDDFQGKVTMDMLNSRDHLSIPLKPEVEQQMTAQMKQEQVQPVVADPNITVTPEQEDKTVGRVDGNALYDLNEKQGWFREGKHGREVTVDEIRVEPVKQEAGKEAGDAKYRMTAVINGESVSHEITQKQYDKFMALDDYHRMKLFSHIFHEVDMKNVPGASTGVGVKIGAALLAGLAVTHDLAHGHSGPAVFVEHHHDEPRGHVFYKPGVDSPQDIAARAFEAGLNAGEHGVGIGHQR